MSATPFCVFFPVIVLLLIARDSFFLRCEEEDPLRGCCVKEEDRSIHAVAGVGAFGWADTFDRGCATGIPYFFFFFFFFIFILFFICLSLSSLRLRMDEWMGEAVAFV